MTPVVHALLIIIALLCFFSAAIKRPPDPPVAIGWMGMSVWMLDILITALSGAR